jgi:hypothetical protein
MNKPEIPDKENDLLQRYYELKAKRDKAHRKYLAVDAKLMNLQAKILRQRGYYD